MAAEQTLVQIRVDTTLKEQAAEIFERIGIDTPTAVRMFFKAVVREQGLPFGTNVSVGKEKSEAEKAMDFFKNLVMYEPPVSGDNDNVIVVMPLENGREISVRMIAQLVSKVPAGSITCWDHIFAFLSKLYGRSVENLPSRPLLRLDMNNNPLPYWRIVSARGVLADGRGGSRESQREQLLKEGLQISQRGSIEGSYKVENYSDHWFRFENLRILKD